MSRSHIVLGATLILLMSIVAFERPVRADDGSATRSRTSSKENSVRQETQERPSIGSGEIVSAITNGILEASAKATFVAPNVAVPRVLAGEEEKGISPGAQTQILQTLIRGAQELSQAQNTSANAEQEVTSERNESPSATSAGGYSGGFQNRDNPPAASIPENNTNSIPSRPSVFVSEGFSGSTQIQSLEEIGQAIHQISKEKTTVARKVNEIVSQSIERSALLTPTIIGKAAPEVSPQTEKGQDAQGHQQEITNIINKSLPQTLEQPTQKSHVAEPVPKSPIISDIQQLIKKETGQSVDLNPGSRLIANELSTASQNINEQRQKLVVRDGLELYRDTDHDGVSDYDEKYLYHTDPNNAYTSGSSFTDGERILLGLSPFSTSTTQVAVESPKQAGKETRSLFEITDISLARHGSSTEAVSTSSKSSDTTPTEKISISGRALPNSFVTLYIFSNPIVVTIKTDQDGLWKYTLDTTLENGQHELYAASVNDSGKIIAKSSPVPFTKTAEALEYQPLVIQDVTQPTPLDTLREYFLLSGLMLAFIFIGVAIVATGLWRQRALPPLA